MSPQVEPAQVAHAVDTQWIFPSCKFSQARYSGFGKSVTVEQEASAPPEGMNGAAENGASAFRAPAQACPLGGRRGTIISSSIVEQIMYTHLW